MANFPAPEIYTHVVVFHYPCSDGAVAAYEVYKKLGASAFYLPANYDERHHAKLLHLAQEKDVIYVDFSDQQPFLEKLLQISRSVWIIDHHKSAVERLADFSHPNLRLTLDIQYSGAVLAAREFGANLTVLTEYVQDRDLWQWKLPDSKLISEVIALHTDSFSDIEAIEQRLTQNREDVAREGRSLERAMQRRVGRVAQNTIPLRLAGFSVPGVNATSDVSEVGHEVAVSNGLAAVFQVVSEAEVRVSLRVAQDNDFDATVIAKAYGGGGHPKACGFTLTLPHFLETIHAQH